MLLAVSKPLNTHRNFEPTVSYLFEKCHMPKNSKVNAGFYKLWALGFPKYTTGFQSHTLWFRRFGRQVNLIVA